MLGRTVFIILPIVFLAAITSFAQYEPAECLNTDEELLAQLVNEYRVFNGLLAVPISQTMTLVAQWHVADHDYATEVTHEYGTDPTCNQHSWYGIPGAPYTTCCYNGDPDQYICMWNKPSEVSAGVYSAFGFELAAYGYGSVEDALQAWQNSPVHNSMILNLDMWSNHNWLAMGMGVDSGRYFLWFSTLTDPEGNAVPCLSSATDGDMAGVILMHDAYPNPFNPQTTIAFDVASETAARLAVYDVSGRLVDVLIDNEIVTQGRNERVWQGRDLLGRIVPAGVYFYRLEAGGYTETKSVVLVN